MAKGFGKMFRDIDRDVSSLTLLGAIKAAERTVEELQKEGPSWTGQFSNSWQITGPQGQQIKGDGRPGEPRPLKFPTAPFTGPQAAATLLRINLLKNKVVFTVSNFSPWAGQATDLLEDSFYRPTKQPQTQLGLSKWQVSSAGRSNPTFRGSIASPIGKTDTGGASRTAELDWFTTYATSGRLDKSLTIEMDNMLRRL